MSEAGPAAGFIGKWRARWPEWNVAEAFVAAGQRPVAEAWFTLLQEFYDAAWSGQDPTPGLAKLAWWHEELEGWAKGARRHPLGELLQRLPAPWSPLGRALNAFPSTRGQPVAEAVQALVVFAQAVQECEATLFPTPAAAAVRGSEPAIVHLGERVLLVGDRGDAAWLLQHWPRIPGAARPRRLQAALLRNRLATLPESGEAVPGRPLRVLLSSWSAARRG